MRGVFDIVGPIMIGPSSSHTAGAARLGLMAGKILGEPVAKAEILLHGSWARERHIDRTPVNYGVQSMSSTRGEEGHQTHPFMALLDKTATEDAGDVYGITAIPTTLLIDREGKIVMRNPDEAEIEAILVGE